ncbi:hypothetical protein F1C76_12380 [Geodermatophilaceae bacterium NBWT11]|nr:hypothetical protein F1C76_12380 [Geodermatophilaceae bacterium NBWT11]
MPDEARQQTASGADAAFRYYLSLIGRQAGVDGGPLRQLSQDCELCTFFADQSDADALEGISFQGGEITVAASAPPAVNDLLAEFSATVDQTAVSATDAQGQALPDRSEDAVFGVPTSASMTWSTTSQAWITTSLLFE